MAANQLTDTESLAQLEAFAKDELVSKSEPTEPAVTSTPNLKRKATDQNLEILTVDPHFDLTLIVGTPEHEHGQRALRVNRGSMRNVSDIWTKMLTGDWAERKQSEIELPDDSWKTLLLVLRTAHLQFAQLPDELSAEELWALAVLTDKYNLSKIVRVMLELKKWLAPYKIEWEKWPSSSHIQEFAEITLVFGLEADHEYLVNRLAVEVQVDEKEVCFKHGSRDKQVKLRSSLPDRILTRINDTRISILYEWLDCIDTAVGMAIEGRMDIRNTTNPSCSKDLCSVTRCGVLMRGLHAAGVSARLGTPGTMYQSVATYWKGLKNIGADFKPYSPCDKPYGHRKGTHFSYCSFESCFGDFGVINKAEAVLKQYAHKDVFRHLQNDDYLEAVT